MPPIKRHKSTQTESQVFDSNGAKSRVLQCRQLVANVMSFLDWMTPPSTPEDPKASSLTLVKRLKRDKDQTGALLRSDRANAKLTCTLYRRIIHKFDMDEDLRAKGWFKELSDMIVLLRLHNKAEEIRRNIKLLLTTCAFNTLHTKNKICNFSFDRTKLPTGFNFGEVAEGLNIMVTLWKTGDSDGHKSGGFEVFYSWCMRRTLNQHHHWQTLNAMRPIGQSHSDPYNGLCLMYRTDIQLLNVENLVPVLTNNYKAIQKLLNSKKPIFLPLAKLSNLTERRGYEVHVHVEKISCLLARLPKEPDQFIRVMASLINAISQLHQLKIVARVALFHHDIYVDKNYCAFLTNYTGIALAEEDSEQNQKLFADDINNLGKLLGFILFKEWQAPHITLTQENPHLAFMKALILPMIAEESQRPNIQDVETHFLKLVNEHFRLNGEPTKFESPWGVVAAPPLTLGQ